MCTPDEVDQPGTADAVRLALMDIGEALTTPWREWLAGAVAYFVGEGFTEEQARAMAASEYVTVLGSRIENSATRSDEE